MDYATKRITLITNIALPTASSHITTTPLGFGVPGGITYGDTTSFFIGTTTFSHLSWNWYIFNSYGARFALQHDTIKYGNQFVYQAGLGHNLGYLQGWVFALTVEFSGIYLARDISCSMVDLNSGSNTGVLGSQLWISSERFILQGGVAYTVFQRQHGAQNPTRYIAAVALGWKF